MVALLEFLSAALVLAFFGVTATLVALGVVAVYHTVVTWITGEEWI